ncbi:hypothetical protein Cgig2_028136 [Carnegiea gigantea]|uniref:DUF4283 domain-containing protein n=1 Tax=Carnegiea gigantea TaxID=171969 RepID=A0A9Q1JZ19_9CARY|nr:hypothetical protein Cgig2_024763 [Carnegiea gigantea]KAJ8438233.1 hypothetical protein Cgig2_028136 [Carnegiea gigantea]
MAEGARAQGFICFPTSEVEYSSNIVIRGVMGANPPLDVIDGYVHRIWKHLALGKVVLAQKGVFMVCFTNEQDKLALPELDHKYWGLESPSKLSSMLGIPIKTDKTTNEKIAIKYTRLLVEVLIARPFPDHIDFMNDWDIVFGKNGERFLNHTIIRATQLKVTKGRSREMKRGLESQEEQHPEGYCLRMNQ